MLSTSIIDKCKRAFNPILCELIDESWRHRGHAEMLKQTKNHNDLNSSNNTNRETHFSLKLISHSFDGLPLVKRHQMVYEVLREEFTTEKGLHALSLDLKTPLESANE